LGITHRGAVLISGSLFAFFLSMEIGRKYLPFLNDLLINFWGPFMRKHEVNQRSGMFYFITGTVCITSLFDKTIVVLSLIYLSIGDPLASLLGIIFKHVKSMRLRTGKSLLGTFGMFMICILMTRWILMNAGLSEKDTMWIATLSALAASFSELICPNPLPLDDNLVIPLCSAITLSYAFHSVGINPYHIHLFPSIQL